MRGIQRRLVGSGLTPTGVRRSSNLRDCGACSRLTSDYPADGKTRRQHVTNRVNEHKLLTRYKKCASIKISH